MFLTVLFIIYQLSSQQLLQFDRLNSCLSTSTYFSWSLFRVALALVIHWFPAGSQSSLKCLKQTA